MKSEKTNGPDFSVLRTGTSISDMESWFSSLRRQLRELDEERKKPRTPLKITAKEDPRALEKLIEFQSPIQSIVAQIRVIVDDIRHPKKIETTAEPVEVEKIWSEQRVALPGSLSIAIHLLAVAIVLLPVARSSGKKVQVTETFVPLYTPATLVLNLPPKDDPSGGGGGGGKRQLTSPSLGRLPRLAEKQLVPPDPEPPKNPRPLLIAEPTLVAPQLSQLPTAYMPNLGDIAGLPSPPSSGPGVGSGIGTGQGRGVGEGKGPGFGPGEGGGFGGGVFRVGGGVTPPAVLYKVDPQYSEEARKAKYQGTVVLEAIVRRDGAVDILRVVRSLGFGLDENAINALKQWRFRPGMRNGIPVDVALNIEVNFNLR